jgi:hypothetical protein
VLDAFAMALQEVFINIGWSGWYEKLGFSVWQAGAWGDIGKPDSGQYHYMDTDKIGGVSVELIHAKSTLSYREHLPLVLRKIQRKPILRPST